MKTLYATLVVLTLFVVGCGSDNGLNSNIPGNTDNPQGGIAATYFPLEEGLAWTYKDGSANLRITGSNPTIYGPAYHLSGLFQDRVLYKTFDDKVMELREDSWRLLFDLGAAEKATWTLDTSGDASDLLDGSNVTVESRTEEVTTPFGTFKNVILLTLTPREGLFDAGISQMWFAPGVGLVKWSESSIGGLQVHELSNFEAVRREVTH